VIPALLFAGQGATFAAVAGLGVWTVRAPRRIESSLSAINASLTMIEARLAVWRLRATDRTRWRVRPSTSRGERRTRNGKPASVPDQKDAAGFPLTGSIGC
jgi:hypothetical protein